MPGPLVHPLRARRLRSWARVVGSGGQGAGGRGARAPPPPRPRGPGSPLPTREEGGARSGGGAGGCAADRGRSSTAPARGPLGAALHPFKQQGFFPAEVVPPQDSDTLTRGSDTEGRPPAASGAPRAFPAQGRAAAGPPTRGEGCGDHTEGNGERGGAERPGLLHARGSPAPGRARDTPLPQLPPGERRRRPGGETSSPRAKGTHVDTGEEEARRKPGQRGGPRAERGAAGAGRPGSEGYAGCPPCGTPGRGRPPPRAPSAGRASGACSQPS